MTGVAVGRMVHYVSRGSADGKFPPACRSAVISEVAQGGVDQEAGLVGLVVLNPTGLYFLTVADGGSKFGDGAGREPGSWHWPERA